MFTIEAYTKWFKLFTSQDTWNFLLIFSEKGWMWVIKHEWGKASIQDWFTRLKTWIQTASSSGQTVLKYSKIKCKSAVLRKKHVGFSYCILLIHSSFCSPAPCTCPQYLSYSNNWFCSGKLTTNKQTCVETHVCKHHFLLLERLFLQTLVIMHHYRLCSALSCTSWAFPQKCVGRSGMSVCTSQ